MIQIPRSYHDVYKADMHVHWRSLMKYSAMREAMLAKGIDPASKAPGFHTQNWKGLLAFHREYEDVYSRLTSTPEEMHDAVLNYLKDAAAENCIYTEVSLTLRADTPGKVPQHEMLDAFIVAKERARRETGIETRLIANIVRDFGGAEAFRVARHAVRLRDSGYTDIVGLGLSGDETCSVPVSEFVDAFAFAVSEGLNGTAHAGEVNKSNMVETMNVLGPYLRRIGHGITALEDQQVLRRHLPELVLEICHTVNHKLGKCESMAEHPSKELWEAGYHLVFGTDNPGPLQTSIGNEYRIAHEICGFNLLQLSQVTSAAIEHSFVDKKTKERLLAPVRAQKYALKGQAAAVQSFPAPGL